MSSRSLAVVLLVVMALASALMLAIGVPPLTGYALMLDGTIGSQRAFGQVLFRLTPLVLTGLAVAVPLRAGLFNIGAESQVIIGAFVCALVGAALPEATSAWIAIPLCMLAAALGGAAIGAWLGVMRVRFGIHEVIGGLLGNLIVRAAMVGLGAKFFLRESVHTKPVIAAAQLPRLSKLLPEFVGSAANVALFVALVLVVVVPIWQERSRLGFLLRAVRENPDAVRAAGHRVGALQIFAMTVGGALGGLAAVSFVLGYKRFYEDGFSGGVGFLGLAVAMLGRGKAWGISAAALLLAYLQQGGFAMNERVPKEITDILSAVLLAGAAVAIAAAQKKSSPDAGAPPW